MMEQFLMALGKISTNNECNQGNNNSMFSKRKGVLAFGTVDSDNVFHLLPRINNQFVDFKLLRELNNARIRSNRKLEESEEKSQKVIFKYIYLVLSIKTDINK